MWRIYQVRRLVAVSTVLFAGLLAEVAVAQAPTAACNPTIAGPNGTCTSTTTVTKPATADYEYDDLRRLLGGGLCDSATWQGLNWEIGIAADFDVGVSLVLEAHYFSKEWLPFANCQDYNCNDIAIGPFVAIEAGNATTSGSNGPITGYALGLMVGLHHPDPTSAKTSNSSWNFGVGLRVDPSATVLGDGVRANQAPPPGITTADQLLKREPRYGIMLLSSFSF